MAARFTKLTNAIKTGLKDMQTKAAVDQIEYWEEQMKDLDISGSKGIAADLHSLKVKLQAEEVDGSAVQKLLSDLAEKTAKISGRVEDKAVTEQLTNVSTGLDKAA
ncbi:MAG: hypothetical protein H7Y08_12060 [Rhizobiaceae bacterium]|nr:hypothetical protein [Rhizobiaceae bacterium]